MMDRSRRGRLTALAAFSLLSLAVGCGGDASDAAGTEEPPVLLGPENLFVSETRTLIAGPTISGTLVPEREATVRAEIGGAVVQVAAEDGQTVRRGQLLGRISDDGVRDQVESARSAVRTATEAHMVAKRNAERAEKLASGGAMSDRDLEQARWSATSAETGVADAKARLATAERQLGYTQLRAPIAGVVSERHVNPGDVVSSGNPLFTVVDPSSLRLEAQVPVSALGSLKVGTAVPFSIDGYGSRSFEGRVLRINPTVDPASRQVRVTVALPNESGRLVAGLFAQGRVAVETRSGVVVPISAVNRDGARTTATRISGGTANRVEVEIGLEDPALEMVEVTAGLAAGDTVITGAARSIQPGARVRPAADAERSSAAGGR
jgi:RND family efflux transporter MFP subunit